MDIMEVGAQARDAMTVKRVFGEPFEKDGSGVVERDGTIDEVGLRELASRTVMVRIHPSTPGETAQKKGEP